MCTPCIGGKYCPSLNMTADGPSCSPGYYCESGSPVPDPLNATYGDECPTGNCILGSSVDIVIVILYKPCWIRLN